MVRSPAAPEKNNNEDCPVTAILNFDPIEVDIAVMEEGAF